MFRSVEPVEPTSAALRGLVNELEDKLSSAPPSRITNPDGIEVIGQSSPENRWSGLVSDLDQKLATSRSSRISDPDGIEIIPERRMPGWLGIVLVTLLGIGIGAAVVQPWEKRCTYGRELCAVAELDIDALRITVPDSRLIAALPNIDALDPHDELTAGEIFAMERFSHLDFAELLTDEDIDRLLAISG